MIKLAKSDPLVRMTWTAMGRLTFVANQPDVTNRYLEVQGKVVRTTDEYVVLSEAKQRYEGESSFQPSTITRVSLAAVDVFA